MKKAFLFVAVLICTSSLMQAQPPEGPADKGMTFGVKTNEKGAVAADDLSILIQEKKDVEVKVKGKVVDVCRAEGCWLKMETAKGSIMIRMKNHAFMVPLSMNGKTIVATGIANNKETTVEMLKHYAEDAGKSKEEIAAITEPKKEILLQATGILVL